METCETCRFWKFKSESLIYGTCRRYPPPFIFDDRLRDLQPCTSAHDWCGEWKRREDAAQTF